MEWVRTLLVCTTFVWKQYFSSGVYNSYQHYRAMAMRREMPCPYRIIDDMGGAFAMGCFGGVIFHFCKGAWRSPKSTRFNGGIRQLARRAPIIGGGFAQWGGLFSFTDCVLTYVRKTEDAYNQVAAGFITGGLLAIRAGPRVAFRNAVIGGIILTCITIVEVVFMKQMRKKQLQQSTMAQEHAMKEERVKASRVRPDLFSADGHIKFQRI